MITKRLIFSLLAAISIISAGTVGSVASAQERRREPNPPRYPGDNSPPPENRRPEPPPPERRRPEPPPPPEYRRPEPPPEYRRPEPPPEYRRPEPGYGEGGRVYPRDPNPRNPYPRDPNPYEPNPYQPNPYEPNPGRPAPGYGEIRRDIFLNRRFGNETLSLRRLAGIGSEYQGYSVVAVEVQLNGGRYANADLLLRMNGYVEDTQRANNDFVVLRPRSSAILGYDMETLQLDIRGVVDVGRVTVVLSSRGGGGGWDPSPRVEEVNLSINRQLWNSDRINLSQYIDLRRFAGYTLDSVVISARAEGGAAIIDVLSQGSSQGSVSLDPYMRSYQIGLYARTVIDSWTSVELLTRGQMTIYNVTLRLVRGGR